MTPLHWAAFKGHVDVVQALIQKGANINAKDNDDSTPLHWAAFMGHVDIVNALIQQNAEINLKDNDGVTPLHLAAQNNHGEVVKKLVLAGADAAGITINEQSILHWAAENCHVDVVKTLLKADQQSTLFKDMIFIERSAVVVGALLSSCLFAESINPKGWIDTLSQAIQSQLGSALCAAVLLASCMAAGCMAACRQLFYLRSRAAYAQATCGQQAVIVGGKLLMAGAAATLFTAVAFSQTGLIALCNNPVTAGMVLGAVCLIGVAGYLSDRTYTTVISGG
jgi:hypothetical protein